MEYHHPVFGWPVCVSIFKILCYLCRWVLFFNKGMKSFEKLFKQHSYSWYMCTEWQPPWSQLGERSPRWSQRRENVFQESERGAMSSAKKGGQCTLRSKGEERHSPRRRMTSGWSMSWSRIALKQLSCLWFSRICSLWAHMYVPKHICCIHGRSSFLSRICRGSRSKCRHSLLNKVI